LDSQYVFFAQNKLPTQQFEALAKEISRISQLQSQQYQPLHHEPTSELEETFNQFMQVSITNQENIEASIKR